MHARFSKYIAAILFPAIAVLVGCGESRTVSPSSPDAVEAALLTAEPAAATPEFLSSPRCSAGNAFGVRLSVTVHAGSPLMVRDLRFDFTDHSGRRALPIPMVSATAPMGSDSTTFSTPIPIPSEAIVPVPESGLPVPGVSQLDGVRLSAGGSRTIPVHLRFGCGLTPVGLLFVTADTTDMRGTSFTPQIRINVGD